MHGVDRRPGRALVLRDARRLGDLPDVQHVMGHAVALLGGELGGADVHAAIKLHGVGVDHLTAQRQRQRHSERALTGRGGTDDRDHDRLGRGAPAHADPASVMAAWPGFDGGLQVATKYATP